MRYIGKEEIENIAIGAALLGTGGGGDPYIGKLMALQAVEKYGPIKLISPDELNDDDLVVPSAMMGAPTVMIEKIPSGSEAKSAFFAAEKLLGKKITATMPIEAGGVNSLLPLALAAEIGLPVVDCDGMGRAFPELQMVTFHLDGISTTPMVLGDEKGNSLTVDTVTGLWAERIARVCVSEMGGSLLMTIYPMNGKQVKASSIYNSLSIEQKIGEIITEGRKNNYNPIANILKYLKGFLLFTGKIVDIERNTAGGFVRGKAVLEGLGDFKSQNCIMQFQNENLVVQVDGKYVCTTPDLITSLDTETGMPITTEGLKYGNRISVIALPCDEKWRTPKGIETVGPRYFKYDIDYVPVEILQKEVSNV